MAGIKKGAELRQKIIDTAWGLFYENGYENTTVNDIIRKVGTSKGGFYYYFKAKEDLLNSLYSVFDREYENFMKIWSKTGQPDEAETAQSICVLFY